MSRAAAMRSKGDPMSLFWLGLAIGMSLSISGFLILRVTPFNAGASGRSGTGSLLLAETTVRTSLAWAALAASSLLMAVVVSDGQVQPASPPGTSTPTSPMEPAPTSADSDIARMKSYISAINLVAKGPQTAEPKSQVGGLPDVETMIGDLERRLRANSADIEGWRTLGWSYSNTNRPNQAVKAYEQALTLAPDRSDIQEALKTAMTAAGTGVPPPLPSSTGFTD